MSPSKTAKKAAQTSSTDPVLMWLYALGMVVAGVAGGLGFQNDILTWVLLLVAVLVGLFYFNYEEVGEFGLRAVILYFALAALGMVPVVGGFISGFFGGWVFFLFPVVLMMALKFFWHKRVAPLFS